MTRRLFFLLMVFFLCAATPDGRAQEVLRSSRIRARSLHKRPSLGLPQRLDGDEDTAIWLREGRWYGGDSLYASPAWMMAARRDTIAVAGALAQVFEFHNEWAVSFPGAAIEIVWGPARDGWFAALCQRTQSGLGWKSIAFLIPPEGPVPGKSIYGYSKSVNWMERHIGYNLFPRLPGHLQEIIEEMTATELLCPWQEFDPGLDDPVPEREIDHDFEDDAREAML